jgi:transposase-like protein
MGGTRRSDDFRAGAVLMVQASGWPQEKGGLVQVAKHLNVNERTLRRWVMGDSNPPPDKIVRTKKLDLQEVIRTELQGVFIEMGRARPEASYRDLGTVAGILIDKLQLLNGEAPAGNTLHIIIDR